MPHEVSIQEEQGYIRVEISGTRVAGQEADDSVRVWSQVAEVCQAKKIDRILAISSVTGHLPAEAAQAIAYSPERYGWSRRFKTAFVACSEEALQYSFFVEDIAVSGGYQVRIFDDEKKAKAWLLEN